MKKLPYFIDSYTKKLIKQYKKLKESILQLYRLGLLNKLSFSKRHSLFKKHARLERKLTRRLAGMGLKIAGLALFMSLNAANINAQYEFQFDEQLPAGNPINEADNQNFGDPNMNYSRCDFVDIDNDGDFDAFIGWNNGQNTAGIEFWENTGTNLAPVFAYNNAANPLGSVNDEANGPQFVDIDGDGDLDVFNFAGNVTGKTSASVTYGIDFYRNNGTAAAPSFTLDNGNNPFSAVTQEYPTFVDIDNDGDFDCYTGDDDDGTIRFYENTGTATSYTFAAPVTVAAITGLDRLSHLDFVDIDADGDMDLYIGHRNGGSAAVVFYQNTGTVTSPTFTLDATNNKFTGISGFGEFASIDFIDIDNDGDKDAFLGTQNGDVLYYQNNPLDTQPTTWDGTSWDNAPPTSGKDAIVNGDNLVIVDNLQTRDLTINSPYEVTVASDQVLIVHGDLTNNGSVSLKVDLNQAGSLIDNGTITGSGTVKMEIYLEANKYHHIASPFNYGDVSSDEFTNRYPNPYWNANFLKYNETNTSNNWANGWEYAYTDESTPDDLEVARGYSVYFDTEETVVLEGTPNTGTINYNVTLTDGAEVAANEGWNLIGNPYPSKLSAESFLVENAVNSRIEGYLRFWNDANGVYSTDDYAYWNLTGEIGSGNADITGQSSETTKKPTNYIAPGQGFFVKALGNFSLVFNNSMRLRSTAGSVFFKSATEEEPRKLKLGVISPDGYYNEILVAFDQNASDGFDNLYDAPKDYFNDKIGLYTLLNNKNYGIQTLGFDNVEIKTIPLGIFAGVSGDYTFTKVFLKNFEDHYKVYLVDKQQNAKIDLAKNKNYTVSIGQETNNTRFELVFEPLNIWNGGYSENWSDSQNWSDGVPSSMDHVRIPSDKIVYINDEVTCYNLIVDAGGTLVIAEEASLTVSKDLELKTSKSISSNLIEFENMTIGGKALYSKDFSFHRYKLISVPISDNVVPEHDIHDFYSYDKSATEENWIYKFDKISSGSTFDIGKAYSYNGSKHSQLDFSGAAFNSGTIEIPVEQTNLGTNRLQLVGNPYPSGIDMSLFYEENSSVIDRSLYFINRTNSQKYNTTDFSVCNLTGSISGGSETAPDGIIKAGQGFYVYISESTMSNSISFTNQMRTVENSAEKGGSDEISKLKVSLTNKFNLYNETLIGLTEKATVNYDPLYDAYKLKSNQLISLYTKQGSSDYAIQALPDFEESGEHSIPLAFLVGEEGEFILNFFEIANFEDYDVSFEDIQEGVTLNIKEVQEYSFTSEKGLFESRFIINISKKATSVDDKEAEENINVFVQNNNIIINNPSNSGYSKIAIFDEKGALIFNGKINSSITIPASKGFYLVKIYGEKKMFTEKIVIE